MFVIKRDGTSEQMNYDKITARIENLCYGLDRNFIDPAAISQRVISGVYKGIKTTELDTLAAEVCANLASEHYDFSILGGRIEVSNIHKSTSTDLVEVAEKMNNHFNFRKKTADPRLSDKVLTFIQKHAIELNAAIVYERDFNYNYFGIRTLMNGYLTKLDGVIVERPQHMLMRVACALFCDSNNPNDAIECYNMQSQGYFTNASPTILNAGRIRQQLASCFLTSVKDDSIEGIFETNKQSAIISKDKGGIGLAVSCIRASGSDISGGGKSDGLIPFLRCFDMTSQVVNQGGARPGAFADYLEIWHADFHDWLQTKKKIGSEHKLTRNLNKGIWMCDLFMKRVENNEDWSFFCPNEANGLDLVWGEEHDKLYEKYEQQTDPIIVRRKMKARDVWDEITKTQCEVSMPYLLFKDACNAKSNQKNLGTIRCSNLCTEIIEYSSPNEISVCTLATIALNMFVTNRIFNFQLLYQVTRIATKNLNKVLDVNFYGLEEAKYSNLKHRPIGIGVQGFADMLILMRFPFDSEEAAIINRQIFETIYFAACTESNELAQTHGYYESYMGSPMSQGQFQFDLWGQKPRYPEMWNWDLLKQKVAQHGVRNSLLVALPPTATTSQILGNNECFEPYTSNLYVRRTKSGEFILVSKHLVRDLVEIGLWNTEMKSKIIQAKGSIQTIDEIPRELKNLYKTAFEIKGKTLIDLSADRGSMICQSQSLNVYMDPITPEKLSAWHFYAWKKGLKTSSYYCHSKAAADAVPVTLKPKSKKRKTGEENELENKKLNESKKQKAEEEEEEESRKLCSLANKNCESCSG